MLFTGTYEHTIDSKNRLSVPAQIRSQIDARRDGTAFYVVPGRPPNCLWLFTERMFESLADGLGSELLPDEDLLSFEQRYFSNAQRVEIDPQGRILLPERLLRQSSLGRDVVICGIRDHLEIRRRDEWERNADADWQSFPELQLKARRALERTRRQSGLRPEEN